MTSSMNITLATLNMILIMFVVIAVYSYDDRTQDSLELNEMYARQEDLMSQQLQLIAKMDDLNRTVQVEELRKQALKAELEGVLKDKADAELAAIEEAKRAAEEAKALEEALKAAVQAPPSLPKLAPTSINIVPQRPVTRAS